MSFTPIDYDRWERREYLEFFRKTAVYMTAQVEITPLYHGLKERGMRLYPALVYCAAKVINEHLEFRYAYNEAHQIGVWDVVHPYYTVPRKDNPALFSMKYTAFDWNFSTFYEAFLRDYALAEHCGRLLCDAATPPNVCGISIVPKTQFTSFSFGGDPKDDFTPFVLFGRFVREKGRVMIPVGTEFSHAVNDGVHISRFFEQLGETARRLLPDKE